MPILSRMTVSHALWLAAAVCVVTSLHFMYQAGCTGDLKGGAFGDFSRALQIEGKGVALAWLGLCFGSAALFVRRGASAAQRIAGGVGFLVIGAIGTTVLGIQFEVWGVQQCFAVR